MSEVLREGDAAAPVEEKEEQINWAERIPQLQNAAHVVEGQMAITAIRGDLAAYTEASRAALQVEIDFRTGKLETHRGHHDDYGRMRGEIYDLGRKKEKITPETSGVELQRTAINLNKGDGVPWIQMRGGFHYPVGYDKLITDPESLMGGVEEHFRDQCFKEKQRGGDYQETYQDERFAEMAYVAVGIMLDALKTHNVTLAARANKFIEEYQKHQQINLPPATVQEITNATDLLTEEERTALQS